MTGTAQLNELGEELYRRGETDQALQAFEEAARIIPSSARAHSNIAAVYWARGERDAALRHIEQAFAVEPENKRVLLNCAEINAGMSRRGRAASICQQYLASHPDDPDVLQLFERITGKHYDHQAMTGEVERAPVVDPTYLEQPVHDRASLINYCLERFGSQKYLEIGCHEDGTFNQVRTAFKVGIDPVKGGTLRVTSDEFFRLSDETFDVVFIDGLHYCEQVYKDVRNALLHLRRNGVIILHDCNPQEEIHQLRDPVVYTWHGDVWKAFVLFRQDPNLDCVVGDFDGGLGVIRVRENPAMLRLEKPYQELTWQELVANREQYLRPHTPEQLQRWL